MDDCRIPVEELMEFPTDFAFKVVGHHTLTLPQHAVDATKRALGEDREVRFRTRLSRRAAYMSVTVTARIESVTELHAVYARLRRLNGVITIL